MRHSASVRTHVATHVATVQTAGIPKKKMPIAVVGRSAIITSSMMRDTLEFACACGLELRMKCSAVSFGFIVFSLDHLTT